MPVAVPLSAFFISPKILSTVSDQAFTDSWQSDITQARSPPMTIDEH